MHLHAAAMAGQGVAAGGFGRRFAGVRHGEQEAPCANTSDLTMETRNRERATTVRNGPRFSGSEDAEEDGPASAESASGAGDSGDDYGRDRGLGGDWDDDRDRGRNRGPRIATAGDALTMTMTGTDGAAAMATTATTMRVTQEEAKECGKTTSGRVKVLRRNFVDSVACLDSPTRLFSRNKGNSIIVDYTADRCWCCQIGIGIHAPKDKKWRTDTRLAEPSHTYYHICELSLI
jgi:hypothetical protein